MLIALLIFIRITANPLSNLFQKRLVTSSVNPMFVIFITHLFLTIAFIPGWLPLFMRGVPVEFYFYLTLCSILSVLANVLIVKALAVGQLSVLGPINSYKSVVSIFVSFFLIGELQGIYGFIGIMLIVFGSHFIADKNAEGFSLITLFKEKSVQYRIGALILSATEAVFLKKALMHADPFLTMSAWSAAGLIFSLIGLLVLSNTSIVELRSSLITNKWFFVVLFLSTGLMQLTTLFIFERMNVSYALALFQISSLISVWMGYKYFAETKIKRKFIGSIIMIAGAVLIILFNH